MTLIKNKSELRKLGVVQVTFTELKSNIKKLISKTKDYKQLESTLELLYLNLKIRNE